jgi:hypothetical protein
VTFEILAGSVVAVDTQSLRDAARQFDVAAEHFDGARRRGHDAAARAPYPSGTGPVWDVAARATHLVDATRAVASSLRRTADVYEIVEARSALRLLGREPAGGAERLREVRAWEERMRAAETRSPGAAAQADELVARWRASRYDELVQNLTLGLPPAVPAPGAPTPLLPLGLVPLLAGSFLLALVDRFDRGVLSPRGRLSGEAAGVRVARVSAAAAEAPDGFADALRRIPAGERTRVRVETFTFADRPPEYAVYVTGTRDMAELGAYAPVAAARGDGREPFDAESNLDLYFERAAESYDAARLALRDAGAEPGATVHAFGHSQGGMIVSQLARDGEYDVETLVTYGSPVQLVAQDGTTNVSLRHRDDPVGAGLTGGGSPAAGGGAGSVVIQDTYSPGREGPGVGALIAPHTIDAYARLALEADRTPDPQLAPIRDRLARLAAAQSVEAREYSAERMPR